MLIYRRLFAKKNKMNENLSNKKKPILFDLFAGYGGFHKGLEQAGFDFEKVYFSEIDKHAIANYRYNYEKAEHIGAVEHILDSGIERADIITFGSPCQDFSIAGKRSGLVGERSSLIEYALAAIAHFRPSVYIWENVKGAFSSNNGEDFWAIIKAFADLDYEFEAQLINTLWFLPQNRERIFLVGRLADRCTGQIFPIGENDGLSEQANSTGKRRTQAEHCSTIKENFGNKADDTFIVTDAGYKDSRDKLRDYTEFCPTIKSNYGTGGNNVPIVNRMRRLTEIECERLQGLPDDWTRYGNYDGVIKEISATQRYKMLGNGATVKAVEEIGKRILQNTEL